VRPSKLCSAKFGLGLLRSLELEEEVLLVALLFAKAGVDAGLKIGKKHLNK
jgi:hypothetical protein